MAGSSVEDYLAEKINGKLGNMWRELYDLYARRLWHLMANKLKEYVSNYNFTRYENMLEVREKFMREFEHRVNPLTLTEIVIIMARLVPEKDKAIAMVESIKNVIKNHAEAQALYFVGLSELILADRDYSGRCQRMQEVKQYMDDAEALLNTLPGITSVHGPYYKVSATYYQEIGDYSTYYRDALRYLSCVDVENLPRPDVAVNAFCLGVAALLSENIYNFGDLLAHPVLLSLRGGPHDFLVDLLHAFNRGDIDEFERMRPVWSKQEDLLHHEALLQRKIRLLALMESAFSMSSQNRCLKFEEIAAATRIEYDEVEYLAMKALSLGLIKGHLDEVDGIFEVNWVQPRVLDRNQVGKMSNRIRFWAKEVKFVADCVKDAANDILTHK